MAAAAFEAENAQSQDSTWRKWTWSIRVHLQDSDTWHPERLFTSCSDGRRWTFRSYSSMFICSQTVTWRFTSGGGGDQNQSRKRNWTEIHQLEVQHFKFDRKKSPVHFLMFASFLWRQGETLGIDYCQQWVASIGTKQPLNQQSAVFWRAYQGGFSGWAPTRPEPGSVSMLHRNISVGSVVMTGSGLWHFDDAEIKTLSWLSHRWVTGESQVSHVITSSRFL